MNNKVVNKDPTTQRESLTELLGQLANNSAAVFHDEIELVIQGIRGNLGKCEGGSQRSPNSRDRSGHQFCRILVSLRCIDHRTHLLYGPRHGITFHWSGACFNRRHHCLHRLQETEELDP